jgi:hypothetical protein
MSIWQNFYNFSRPRALGGFTFQGWYSLLQENKFDVNAYYAPRMGVITLLSMFNSVVAYLEKQRYGQEYRKTEIPPPLIVLGAMRTGTTHLRNLLSRDRRFSYPTLYQAAYPQTFLMTESIVPRLTSQWMPQKRLVDNVRQAWDIPSEDEYATLIMSRRSPYLGNNFPKRRKHYEKFFSFEDVPEEDVASWASALIEFVKKLSWKYQRPLILKSPAHTCRIHHLLNIFPDAKFILIHRNPFEVYQSARLYSDIVTRTWRLQKFDDSDVDSLLINRYKSIYQVFFRDRYLIPKGHLYELSYAALVSDPIGEIQLAYKALELPAFEYIEPALKLYVDNLKGYQRNFYPDLPDTLCQRLRLEWTQYFDEWGYS